MFAKVWKSKMKPEKDDVTAPPLKKEGWLRPVWIYQGKKYKTFEDAITVRQQSLKKNGYDPLHYPLSDNLPVTIENIIFDPLYGSPWQIQGDVITKRRAFVEENGKTLTLQIQYTVYRGGEGPYAPTVEVLAVRVNPALDSPDKAILCGKIETFSGSLTSGLIMVNILKVKGEDATLLWVEGKRPGPARSCPKGF